MVISSTAPSPLRPTLVSAASRESAPAEEPNDSVSIGRMTQLNGLRKTGEHSGLSFAGRLSGPIGMVGTMGAIEVVNGALGHSLNALAIVPRSPEGLIGIATSPFLHGNFNHFANNAVGILLAGGMVAAQGPKKFRDVSLITALTSGIGVWLAGAGPTVGASGMVYGYMGYAMARGVFDRRPLPIAMSIASLALLGGSLAGMLPGQAGISWQSHMFGFLGGVAAAALLPKDEPSR